MAEGKVVAVTGASGFIGSHIVKSLLEKGYTVRPVVRDASNETKTNHLRMLDTLGFPGKIEGFYSGDLLKAGSYDGAFAGADYVIHAAAVVQLSTNKGKEYEEIVKPSIQGTQNVIDSCVKAKTVKRVVHTSSIAAILSPERPKGHRFTETDENKWSTIERGDAYGYAKYHAEKLMINAGKEHGAFDVVVINPGVVLGPCLTKAHTKASPVFIRQMLYGNPQPDLNFTFVDVREVALAHVLVLNNKNASFKRFMLIDDTTSMHLSEVFKELQKVNTIAEGVKPKFSDMSNMHLMKYGIYGAAFVISSALVASPLRIWLKFAGVTLSCFIASRFMPSDFHAWAIGNKLYFDSTRSRNELGIKYRPFEECLKDTADSMIENGLIHVKK
eukprot:m.338472 g.338472  ORF g.338472 m.338472 type:complete len:386 (-) comp18430_c0_seq1:56-1213(-)